MKLCELLSDSEERLIEKVLDYACKHKYVTYTSTLYEAWRASIVGLTTAMNETLESSPDIPEIPSDLDFQSDPVIAYGVEQSLRHRRRGVSLKMFLGLLKYYRQSYQDIISEAIPDRKNMERSHLFVDRFFDRMEIGVQLEWLESSEKNLFTELQETNRLLSNEKNCYLTLFESLPVPVIFMDMERRVKKMNHSANILFASALESGFYNSNNSITEQLDCIDEDLKNFIESGKEESILEKSICTKEEIRYFEIKLARMLDVSEKFSGIIVILNDISDRKRIEDSRFLSSQKDWEDTFNTISDMIIAHDTDGNIIRANKAAREFLNIPSAHPLPVDYSQMDQSSVNNFCKIIRQNSGRQTVIEEFDRHSRRHLEITTIPKFGKTGDSPDDVITGTIYVIRDITERKKLENQLLQSQKMEALGHLAGGIAHDFNNLLTAVKGSSYLIRKKAPPESTLFSLAGEIQEETNKGSNLVKALLAYSRKQTIAPSPVDLNNVISSLEDILKRLISEEISLEIKIYDIPLTIMADNLQLQQILMNLATNALHAMPDGGALSISTDQVTIIENETTLFGSIKPGVYARLTVGDTGSGIAEKDILQIFDPFFTTKDVSQGTGLGLSIVYGIVKQLDGHIKVESSIGQGAFFRLYFNLIDQEYGQSESVKEYPLSDGCGTILLAEDDDSVRRTMAEILKDAGYDVIEADDGINAVESYMKHQKVVSVVILDLIMPRMDGKKAYNEIRRLNGNVPIIMTSGYSDEIITKKGLQRERLDFISKPVSPGHFLAKIKKLTEMH